MIQLDYPCKECTLRYIGCHSKCEKYASKKSEHETLIEKQRKETEGRNMILNHMADTKERSRRSGKAIGQVFKNKVHRGKYK